MKKKTKKKDVGLHPIAELLQQIVRTSNDHIMLEKICVKADLKYMTLRNVLYGKPASLLVRKSLAQAEVLEKADIESYCEWAQENGWEI